MTQLDSYIIIKYGPFDRFFTNEILKIPINNASFNIYKKFTYINVRLKLL